MNFAEYYTNSTKLKVCAAISINWKVNRGSLFGKRFKNVHIVCFIDLINLPEPIKPLIESAMKWKLTRKHQGYYKIKQTVKLAVNNE
jgi:hypothetical protein